MAEKNSYHFVQSMVRLHKKYILLLKASNPHGGRKKTLRLFQSSFYQLEVSLAIGRQKTLYFFFRFTGKQNMKIRQK